MALGGTLRKSITRNSPLLLHRELTSTTTTTSPDDLGSAFRASCAHNRSKQSPTPTQALTHQQACAVKPGMLRREPPRDGRAAQRPMQPPAVKTITRFSAQRPFGWRTTSVRRSRENGAWGGGLTLVACQRRAAGSACGSLETWAAARRLSESTRLRLSAVVSGRPRRHDHASSLRAPRTSFARGGRDC